MGATTPPATYTFEVDFYLNVTTVFEAAANGDADCSRLVAADPAYGDGLAIFSRLRRSGVLQPGDKLRRVHTATIRAEGTSAARESAFATGNGAGPEDEVAAYYAKKVRSLSVGDVVVVHTPDGPGTYACNSYGWADVDLRDYAIVEG